MPAILRRRMRKLKPERRVTRDNMAHGPGRALGAARATGAREPMTYTVAARAGLWPDARRQTGYGRGLLHTQSHVACSMPLLDSRDELRPQDHDAR
jgi:hypothetical protein